MPYSSEHKQQTHAKVVEAARMLFNRHGFDGVTIEMIMSSAGLTRGGFYNHFESKEKLYSEAVDSFLMGRGAQWRSEAGVDSRNPATDNAERMIKSYLSAEHLGDIEGQCPMIALPSDVARAGDEVRSSYQNLLNAMVSLFEHRMESKTEHSRTQALSLAALCVGGMILARTLPDSPLADEVRLAAYKAATEIMEK